MIAVWVLLLILTGWRTISISAGPAWITLYGESFAKDYNALSRRKRKQKSVVWALYCKYNGNLWYVFPLGIKSFRIAALADSVEYPGVSYLLTSIRLLWRYFVFCPVMVLLLLWFSFAQPTAHSNLSSDFAQAVAWLLLIASFALMLEAGLANLFMGSWAAGFHLLPSSYASDPNSPKARGYEVGMALFVLGGTGLSILALIALLCRQYGALNALDLHESTVTQLLDLAQLSLASIVPSSSDILEPTNITGRIAVLALWPIRIAYAAILVRAIAKLFK